MPFITSFFSWFGGAFTWLLKDFVPRIAKRLGLGAILGVIQKAVSAIVVTFVIAFFGIVINFAISMFNKFSEFITYLNGIGSTSSSASCLIRVMNASGITAGIQMAAPFYLSVLVFFFIYAAYRMFYTVAKTISDETSKTIESTK